MWRAGEIQELLEEGRVIQKSLTKRKKKNSAKNPLERFCSLMEQGKVSAALRCIGSEETSVLDATQEVLDLLRA